MAFAHAEDTIVVHMDGNGAIGTFDSASVDADGTVGPHGITHVNTAGKDLLGLMREHNLCSTTSFFQQGPTPK